MARLHSEIHGDFTSDILDKLFKRKIYTALSFVETDPELIVKITGLHYSNVLQIKSKILTKFSSPLKTGRQLYSEIMSHCAIIKTGIQNLDTLIDGGFVTGSLYEICGPAGSGKTQICMTVALNVCKTLQDHSVLWIDTKNDISAERLLDMIEDKGSDEMEKAGELMRRIKIVRILKIHEVLSFLHALCDELKVANSKSLVFRLIIIDSLSVLFGRYLGEDRGEGLALLNNLANILRFLAVEYHIVVLMTNLVSSWTVEVDTDSEEGKEVQDVYTPQLGKYWQHIPNTRISVKKLESGAHLLVILKSTNMPIGRTAQVIITEFGAQ